MKTLSVAEIRRLELNSEELGVSVSQLMARAGKALASAARSDGKIVIVCGKGHNGGDGFAAAGVLLRWGLDVRVVLLEPKEQLGRISRAFLDLVPKERVALWGKDRRAWTDAAVVLDCALGTGLQGRPRSPYDQAIRWMNKQAGRVISCDVPSGLGSGLAVKPAQTVTFHAAKDGMKANSGRITVADIGIPAAATHIGLGDLQAGFLRKPRDVHKGDHGRVLVIGGGPFTGAPHYAGMGAVRSGADLVHVATTNAAAATMACWGPDLLVHGVTADDRLGMNALSRILELAHNADALVIGPGIGPGCTELVAAVLDATTQPVVLDAEAIDEDVIKRHGPRLVATPHGGEWKRLAGKRSMETFCKTHGVTVLRKGAVDDVDDGGRTRACHRGHPAMTVGGTGDVLAGCVGALLARGAEPFDAACAAAYLVGAAGEVAAGLRSFGATASDVHEAIPAVLLRLPWARA